jgi:hypothetical protein
MEYIARALAGADFLRICEMITHYSSMYVIYMDFTIWLLDNSYLKIWGIIGL